MKNFISGFKYVLGGFKLIIQPGIRLYVVIPLLINTLLFTAVIVYGATALSDLIDWMTSQWTWAEWLTWLLWPFFVVVSLTIVFFCFSILANLIGAPFNGFLAEAVENRLRKPIKASITTNTLTNLPTVLLAALKSEARKFLYFISRAIPLLLLFIIPLVNTAAPVLWFLFGAWMLTLEYIDYPLGNRDILFTEQRNIIRQKRGLAFGFGVGVMLLTLIPVINFIAMPVAVCAATRMVLEHFDTADSHNN